MSHPILSLIPNIGWNNGVNVNIVDANITEEEADSEDMIYGGPKMLAGPTTLVVKVRDMNVGGNHFYLGFLPEEGLFALFPGWIFWEGKKA